MQVDNLVATMVACSSGEGRRAEEWSRARAAYGERMHDDNGCDVRDCCRVPVTQLSRHPVRPQQGQSTAAAADGSAPTQRRSAPSACARSLILPLTDDEDECSVLGLNSIL